VGVWVCRWDKGQEKAMGEQRQGVGRGLMPPYLLSLHTQPAVPDTAYCSCFSGHHHML
jgi:hypothetical protein